MRLWRGRGHRRRLVFERAGPGAVVLRSVLRGWSLGRQAAEADGTPIEDWPLAALAHALSLREGLPVELAVLAPLSQAYSSKRRAHRCCARLGSA
jgi:hypothetical protein